MKNKMIYHGPSKIIINNNQKLIYKIKKNDNETLFNYFENKNFLNYLPYHMKNDQYEIYRYINDEEIPPADKAIELIYIMSLLHNKTTTYQEVNIDSVKELYESTLEKINNLRTYYFNIQDYIETKIFMSPAEQLLMNNISKIYKALNYSEHKINEWYKHKEKQRKERVVQLHNNLSLKNILLENNNQYLINWDKSTKGYVIYDFIEFYHNEFRNVEMSALFELYQTKYKYTFEEELLFEALISIPKKADFSKNNLINTIEMKHITTYVDKTNTFLSEYYKKNQESNKEEFK